MKFIVHYEQTNDLDIEVIAEDKEEAFEKANEIIEARTFEENVKKSQAGYFEHCYTDEDE